jgi:hypothetical protein
MQYLRFPVLAIALFGAINLGCGHKTPSDRSIATDIQARLYADPATKPTTINVAVQSGVATLTGDVPSSDIALEANKVASGAPGVQRVDNRLTVNGAPATAQASPAPPNASAPQPGAASYPPLPPATSPPVPSAAPPPATSQQAAAEPPSQAPPVPPQPLRIPAGEHVRVRLIDSIDSGRNTAGQTFRATLSSPLISRGRVVVPVGTPVSVLLTHSKSAGRIQGRSELEVRLSRIEYHGHSYAVDSTIYEETGKARGKETAVKTGVGAAAGAIIGAIAGGGRGAAIGSAAGGGAGFGVNALTHGQQVKIASETELTFRLARSLAITP